MPIIIQKREENPRNSLLWQYETAYCFMFRGCSLDPKWDLPEMKFQSTIKEILFTLLFHCGWNEIKFRFGGFPRKTVHSVKCSQLCFDEISACADVSFHMISFLVMFTWYFITQNEISFLSKWPQWSNTHNEFHFGLYYVNSYTKLTRHWHENISFRPKWNLM